MISNPGSSPVNTLMDKSVYDKNNKNTDIFTYVDGKVADKVTSSQVATQISTATSSFVTSSAVDQKIAADKANDPFRWHRCEIIPVSFGTSTTINSLFDSNNVFYKTMKFPMDTTKYMWETFVEIYGLQPYGVIKPTTSFSSIPSEELYLCDSTSYSIRDGNYADDSKLLQITGWASKTTTSVSYLATRFIYGILCKTYWMKYPYGQYGTNYSQSGNVRYVGGFESGEHWAHLSSTPGIIKYIKIYNGMSEYTDVRTQGIVFNYRAIAEL